MPDYMLLLHADEKAGQAVPPADMARWMEKMHAYKDAELWAAKCPGAIWGHIEIREVTQRS